MTGEVCPFCGHDSSFERLQRSERTIGYFWKVVYLLALGTGFLTLMWLYSVR